MAGDCRAARQPHHCDVTGTACSPRPRCLTESLPHLLGRAGVPGRLAHISKVTEPLSADLPDTNVHALNHCHAASSWLLIDSFTHSFSTYLLSTYMWGLVCSREQESTAPSPREPTCWSGRERERGCGIKGRRCVVSAPSHPPPSPPGAARLSPKHLPDSLCANVSTCDCAPFPSRLVRRGHSSLLFCRKVTV